MMLLRNTCNISLLTFCFSTLLSEILFELSKIFRNAPYVNF